MMTQRARRQRGCYSEQREIIGLRVDYQSCSQWIYNIHLCCSAFGRNPETSGLDICLGIDWQAIFELATMIRIDELL